VIRAAVVTVSDRSSRGEREDLSGPEVARLLSLLPAEIVAVEIVPDEAEEIRRVLLHLCDRLDLDLVVTTGGTGVDPRDVTPEATRPLLDREIPGMAEAMRADSLSRIRTAMLSRGVAGVRGRTLVVNLPGSPSGARENLSAILDVIPHAIGKIRGGGGDCARREEAR
jgi:molybdenum cofactor synthesis domain-containing protein